ncbi:prepilin-type N-terminal cleavage/methylation domain-containing protein [Bacteriovoracaceae bacterium]|nr:prepilin-type N-terminal cleavage/methylation domain-containing protein [Bacteriovoracaceae bacterium]
MSKSKRRSSQKGFSLISVIFAIALTGVLALGLMRIFKNSANSQMNFKSGQSELVLSKVISIILNKRNHCTQTFAGITFKKKDIDFDNEFIELSTAYDYLSDEGQNIELYQSNAEGSARTHKRMNGDDNINGIDKSKFDKLKIKSIKLIMNNGAGPCSDDYCEGTITDTGQVLVFYEKPVSIEENAQKQLLKKIFDINLTIETDNSNESTITSCELNSSSLEVGESPYPAACKIRFYHDNLAGFDRHIDLDLNEASFGAFRTKSDIDNNDRFGINPTCSSPVTDIDNYFRDCYIGFGWRDSSRNNNTENLQPAIFARRQFKGVPVIPAGFSLTDLEIDFSGTDVNEDDSFYTRIACEQGTHSAEIDQYVKNTCGICLGHSDSYNLSPQSVSCIKVQDYINDEEDSPNSPQGLWSRINTNTGDVDNNDTFFLGFFCNNQYSPYVKYFSYENP